MNEKSFEGRLCDFYVWLDRVFQGAVENQKLDATDRFFDGQVGVAANAMVRLRDEFPEIKFLRSETK